MCRDDFVDLTWERVYIICGKFWNIHLLMTRVWSSCCDPFVVDRTLKSDYKLTPQHLHVYRNIKQTLSSDSVYVSDSSSLHQSSCHLITVPLWWQSTSTCQAPLSPSSLPSSFSPFWESLQAAGNSSALGDSKVKIKVYWLHLKGSNTTWVLLIFVVVRIGIKACCFFIKCTLTWVQLISAILVFLKSVNSCWVEGTGL